MLKIKNLTTENLKLKLIFPEFIILAVCFFIITFVFFLFIPLNIGIECDRQSSFCKIKERFLFKDKVQKFDLEDIQKAYLLKKSRSSRVVLKLNNSEIYVFNQIGLIATDEMIDKINAYLQNSSLNKLEISYKNNFLIFMVLFMNIPAAIFLILFFLGNTELEFCQKEKILKVTKMSGFIKKQIPFSEIEEFYIGKRKKRPRYPCAYVKFRNDQEKECFTLKSENLFVVAKMNEFLKS